MAGIEGVLRAEKALRVLVETGEVVSVRKVRQRAGCSQQAALRAVRDFRTKQDEAEIRACHNEIARLKDQVDAHKEQASVLRAELAKYQQAYMEQAGHIEQYLNKINDLNALANSYYSQLLAAYAVMSDRQREKANRNYLPPPSQPQP